MEGLPSVIPKSIVEVLNRLEIDENNLFSWKLTRSQDKFSLTVSCKLPAKTPNKAKDDNNSWPSRAWKKILLAFLSTFWHPCSKCILVCFKKDRGGCQVWKCPKVPELGQRSIECKFLYICQILAFLSISYPKLWLKVMQNLFWIIQPCYINKQHHQGMMCVWIKGHLSAKSVKIVAIFYVYRGKTQILCSFYPNGRIFIAIVLGVYHVWKAMIY